MPIRHAKTRDLLQRLRGQSHPPASLPPATVAERPVTPCTACRGTGVSTAGLQCWPCVGTGVEGERNRRDEELAGR